MRVKESNIEKIAFWLQLDQYECVVMSFGLTNAPTIFFDIYEYLVF